MPGSILKPLLVSLAVGLWLRFLLEPTGWLFYELHHATGFDWIYWGYTVFRGGGYFFSTFPYQSLVCLAVAGSLFGLLYWRGQRNARRIAS